MSANAYPLFSIFAFLGFILSLIPLPWHLQAWNSGTCYFMMWTAIVCLNSFINSVVWAESVVNHAPAWCEISIRIILGANVAIPASAMCIVRRLYLIASVQSVTVSRGEKRRAVIIDSLICVLFPLLYIAMQYIVQGHRFDIFEEIGCYPAIYNTLPAYFISFSWPIVLGLISMVYCVLALRAFNHRRLQFNLLLASPSAPRSLTLSKYFRLMALALTILLCTTPLAVFTVYLNATATNIGPWISWSDTHFDYGRVAEVPSLLWRSEHQTVVAFELTRWAGPFAAFVFFGYFGFAQEARSRYRAAYEGTLRVLGLGRFITKKPTYSSTALSGGIKGSYAPPKPAAIPLRPARPSASVASLSTSLASTAGYPGSSSAGYASYFADEKYGDLEAQSQASEYPPSPPSSSFTAVAHAQPKAPEPSSATPLRRFSL